MFYLRQIYVPLLSNRLSYSQRIKPTCPSGLGVSGPQLLTVRKFKDTISLKCSDLIIFFCMRYVKWFLQMIPNDMHPLLWLQVVLRSVQTTLNGTSIKAEPSGSRWTSTLAPSVTGKSCWVPTWRNLSGWITAPQLSVHFTINHIPHLFFYTTELVIYFSLIIF